MAFRERGKERGRQKNINVRETHQLVACHMCLDQGDSTCNPGMCPDWKSDLQPVSYRTMPQPTKPPQPGLEIAFLIMVRKYPISDFLSVIQWWMLNFFCFKKSVYSFHSFVLPLFWLPSFLLSFLHIHMLFSSFTYFEICNLCLLLPKNKLRDLFVNFTLCS